jgi:hypothetical protein
MDPSTFDIQQKALRTVIEQMEPRRSRPSMAVSI